MVSRTEAEGRVVKLIQVTYTGKALVHSEETDETEWQRVRDTEERLGNKTQGAVLEAPQVIRYEERGNTDRRGGGVGGVTVDRKRRSRKGKPVKYRMLCLFGIHRHT